MGWAELVRRNDAEPYDAELGLLRDTLDEAGVESLVIGNGDGADELGTGAEPIIQRQVGLALADGRGVVSSGQLGADLLTQDPAWPYGLRFDPTRVVTAFTTAWDRTVGDDRLTALVEASDLVRAQRYSPLVAEDRAVELRDQALRATDDLFGQLLAEVDPASDAVLLLAPYMANRQLGLTVAALDRPASPSGYLRTATTQRSGIVSLVDVAPTILDTFGITAPDAMEGRPFEPVRSGTRLDERIDHLVTINDASRFRENLLTPTTTFLVLGLSALCGATAIALAGDWNRRARTWIRWGALFLLAVFPLSYVARLFPLEDLGVGFYWAVTLVGAALVALATVLVGARSRQPWLALAGALAVVLLVPILDVMTGSNLSLNAAFGYSPTGNSRLYGISNYSYGQVAVAACILAGLIASRRPASVNRWVAVGLLGFVLVVLGVPFWGSDVGGVLAFTPAVLLFGAMQFGYRIRLRAIVLAGLATLGAITAFGFLDLSRPPEERAHLGRLFERIDREGLEPLLSVVERKLTANLEVSTGSFWVVAIPVGLAFWAFLSRHRSHPLAQLHARIPSLRAGLLAAAVAAVLGSILNDSGAIVGGIAFTVAAASLAFLSCLPPVDQRLDADEPDEPAEAATEDASVDAEPALEEVAT
jgi:hypothetical protein